MKASLISFPDLTAKALLQVVGGGIANNWRLVHEPVWLDAHMLAARCSLLSSPDVPPHARLGLSKECLFRFLRSRFGVADSERIANHLLLTAPDVVISFAAFAFDSPGFRSLVVSYLERLERHDDEHAQLEGDVTERPRRQSAPGRLRGALPFPLPSARAEQKTDDGREVKEAPLCRLPLPPSLSLPSSVSALSGSACAASALSSVRALGRSALGAVDLDVLHPPMGPAPPALSVSSPALGVSAPALLPAPDARVAVSDSVLAAAMQDDEWQGEVDWQGDADSDDGLDLDGLDFFDD